MLVCNWLGLYVGMKMCTFFELQVGIFWRGVSTVIWQHYSWRGLRQIPTYSGKMKRAVQQFTPYSWTKFEWQATKNFIHYITVIMIIFTVFPRRENDTA